ncbi:MAG: efflux RND transporter periplasmic adaptor subunit [Alphaproteobacteria bacterium]|nr:efflux RND transporter periplasmic adaptor subunit [Alphaproteobacteria bacterium]MBV8409817.1 efflux RND transporter periplasmic adaptor subunit [Alphaproteobacteria bacterium]
MTRKRIVLVSLALLVAAGTIGIGLDSGWWSSSPGSAPSSGAVAAPANTEANTETGTEVAQAPTAAPVPVAKPKVQTVSDTVEVTGNAAAVNEVKLLARVVGYLDKIHFEDGALVRAGDPLFTVQQDQYKAQLQQAQAQVQLGQAQLDYAKIEVVRYTALVKKGAATQVDVDHWNYEQAAAEANILGAQAQVAIAQLNLSYTEIVAPFDGQMGKHLVDPGNVVGGNGQQGALAVITQLDPIYVEANISSQMALQVRANLDQRRLTLEQIRKIPIEVALSDESGFPHKGTLQYVAPVVDPQTGTLFLRGVLRNPDRTLLPGLFVKIRLPMEKSSKGALLIPNNALQEDQGGRYVLVLDKDNVTQQRYVQIGQQVGALRVITSGLTPDDRVVIGELWRSSPGTKVTPQLKTID